MAPRIANIRDLSACVIEFSVGYSFLECYR